MVMAREVVWPGRTLLTWPGRWLDVFEDDSLIRVEEVVEDGTLVIRAELPGVDPDEDVELTVEKGMLVLHAVRRETKEEHGRSLRRSEFRYGSFSRTLALPAGATEHDVKASYTDGILEVRVPVDLEQAHAKKVPITAT
jgi:HSP20 family protein